MGFEIKYTKCKDCGQEAMLMGIMDESSNLECPECNGKNVIFVKEEESEVPDQMITAASHKPEGYFPQYPILKLLLINFFTDVAGNDYIENFMKERESFAPHEIMDSVIGTEIQEAFLNLASPSRKVRMDNKQKIKDIVINRIENSGRVRMWGHSSETNDQYRRSYLFYERLVDYLESHILGIALKIKDFHKENKESQE